MDIFFNVKQFVLFKRTQSSQVRGNFPSEGGMLLINIYYTNIVIKHSRRATSRIHYKKRSDHLYRVNIP